MENKYEVSISIPLDELPKTQEDMEKSIVDYMEFAIKRQEGINKRFFDLFVSIFSEK